MKKTILLLLLSVSAALLQANTITINTTAPGTLIDEIEALYSLDEITNLKAAGILDARDFAAMRDKLPGLAVLDLNDAAIAAYSGFEGTTPLLQHYAANTIPPYAFFNMLSGGKETLKSVALSQDTIGDYAFWQCAGLEAVTLAGTKVIGQNAFAGRLEVIDAVLGITKRFSNKIKSVVIPATVDSIGEGAFAICDSVSTFTFAAPTSLRVLNKGVVPAHAKLASITIPASVHAIAAGALSEFSGRIGAAAANPYYSSLQGVLYNKEKTNLVQCPLGLASVEIPASVQIISEKAFYKNTLLAEIKLPVSVDSIGSEAFYESKITKIEISPNASLRAVGSSAFYKCVNLKTITLPVSVKSIGRYAFAYSSAIQSVYAYSQEPPALESGAFDGIDKNTARLYVPAGSPDLYKAAAGWSSFKLVYTVDVPRPSQLLTLPAAQSSGASFVSNISSDGKMAAGSSSSRGTFVWHLDSSTPDLNVIHYIDEDVINNAAAAITNDTVVLGKYDAAGIETTTGTKAALPGVWKQGQWLGLGFGLYPYTEGQKVVQDRLPTAYDMTDDGKTAVGVTYRNDYNPMPYCWRINAENEVEGVVYAFPESGTGAAITSIAADGSTACGWYIDMNGNKRPVIWKSPEQYEVVGELYGECTRISGSGRYAAMTYDWDAAVYDVETGEIKIIRKNAACTDVSNNGIAVGYYNLSTAVGSPRKGFVWSEDIDFIDFSDYISVYAKDVVIPAGYDFSPSYEDLNVPQFISADGTIIGGWSGLSPLMPNAWILKSGNAPVSLPRPKNFNAEVNIVKRTEVVLSWEAPQTAEGRVVTGYVVYRDDEAAACVGPEVREYKDNVPDYYAGSKVLYTVSALYDDFESPKAERKSVTIIGSYAVPFVDDFERENILENHWTAAPGKTGLWYIDTSYPNGFRGVCATYRTEISEGEYSELLTSRPFDASDIDNVYFSFLYKFIPEIVIYETADTLYVELRADAAADEWTTLKKYPLELGRDNSAWGRWSFESFDLTDQVKGRIFQIRFRTAGRSDRVKYVEIDNFQVRAVKEEAPPLHLKAVRKNDKVYLNWQNPSGSYALTYVDAGAIQPVGNEGTPFIAANKYTPEDLKDYQGLYLTSISALFPFDLGEYPAAQLRLAVFKDDERVCGQDILYYDRKDWNTFELNEPVLIEAGCTLYAGLEVVGHADGDMPLYTGIVKTTEYDGRGNLFSEDEGQTWQKLSDSGLKHNWCIAAHIRESRPPVPEEIADIWGYEVFRNGVSITDTIMIFPQRFVDENPLDENSSYSVRAYYRTSAWSAMSQSVTSTTESNVQAAENDENIRLYPNPAADSFAITGFSGKAVVSLIDAAGRSLFSKEINEDEHVSVKGLPKGLYLIKLKVADSTVKEIKLIKE